MGRKVRRKSLRAYRRLIDEQMERARRGEISWSDASSAANAIRVAADTLMTENLLKAQGVSDTEPENHELGEDGGAVYRPGAKGRPFVRKKVSIKRGQDKNGGVIDETTTTIDGECANVLPGPDDEAESE